MIIGSLAHGPIGSYALIDRYALYRNKHGMLLIHSNMLEGERRVWWLMSARGIAIPMNEYAAGAELVTLHGWNWIRK